MKRLSLTFICLLLAMPLRAEEPVVQLKFVLETLNGCYELQGKRKAELAQCVLSVLKQTKNPDGYQVYMNMDDPNEYLVSSFTLTLFNKQGLMIVCNGTAAERINLEYCTSKQVAPLTPEQQMSINPPR
ncbi:hypothetical protein [Legionella septentrionalis]|uniref:DUF3718 domain-containing protein n=1 Tax=Legionella septentrionalis TaxID=2498109 RepID=A0A3S0WQK1_9GAMM|nr:hypothetical protein [Legionella septentrionalis]RUQ81017.1 hypothetical protein EKM59_10895 [Legionella septentrionalis]RUQ99347.1 hypothetical protein ELY11_04815 [Legionella septentrionalis]RUR08764.1 hypothetical protein ELY14_10720 [Legionella septentrionalis]